MRMTYFLSLLATVALGLTSRKFPLPPEIGDALWAVAVYLGLRWVFLGKWQSRIALLALLISFGVEFSQLLTWPWLVAVRQTTLGHLLLGQGFLVQDLLAYAIGILAIAILDKYLLRKGDH